MRMKEVCQHTGLTDRAIRLYIEEKLIQPQISQSHWGRRSVYFSDEDVKCLEDIAVLRKFDFSISQIRAIQEDPEAGRFILENALQEKRKQLQEDQEILSVLGEIDPDCTTALSSMAAALRAAAQAKPFPQDAAEENNWLRAILEIVALCLLLAIGLASVFLLVDMVLFYVQSGALQMSFAGMQALLKRSGGYSLKLLFAVSIAASLGYRIWIVICYGANGHKPEVRTRAVVIDKKQNLDAVVLSSFYSRNGGQIQIMAFKLADGEILELTVPATVFYRTTIGTWGELIYQGRKMQAFTPDQPMKRS